ncbi:HipA domain-containing protein [Dawidia soli]|uniref:HipA domain-containing protein n=1 Tax=Dawidia soli TaxID=2782352 RepID=UPI00374231EB
MARVTEETQGKNYKYELSSEEIGTLIKRHIPTYAIELEKFFRVILFNYIFSNGDAYVKNFSAIQADVGNYVLTPRITSCAQKYIHPVNQTWHCNFLTIALPKPIMQLDFTPMTTFWSLEK